MKTLAERLNMTDTRSQACSSAVLVERDSYVLTSAYVKQWLEENGEIGHSDSDIEQAADIIDGYGTASYQQPDTYIWFD